ncbi:hypothetical protein C8Q80DRAFT_1094329 [Daedaleopsis nitida]|nr:hypothetical protein C8Q80DRAFT_1094329 [Daedaleopsis nitida]
MIVRPAGALPSHRTRSQSIPPRRRANSIPALPKDAHAAAPAQAAQQLPTSPLRVLPGPLGLATSPKHGGAPDTPLLHSISGKRKWLRLRRPTSSSMHTHNAHSGNALGITALISPPASPSVPPRPPRNPARVGPVARPASPSQSGLPRLHVVADPRELQAGAGAGAGADAAAEWEFPLPRGSEFPLQRKKSKSSKMNTSRIMQDESARSDVPFSTVDRTILEELRQKIRAREEQFVVRSGSKYHAFPPDEVPYPRCYDRQMVDMDVWDDLWQIQLGGSVTMHVFETPPARVLDLGCGTGTWILNAARDWKDSCFVGVDVVPLHPDLLQVGCFDLASRITWVQANFLERLPFPNEEFDYVRLVRVARGVPEDKWDALLEEITRVMKPGGAFEMWEEDLLFPGKRRENSTVSVIDTSDPTRPPTPPHTDSSHSSGQDRPLPTHALPRLPPFSYSFDDVSKAKQSLFEDTRPPLHAIPTNNAAHTPVLLRNLDRPPTNPHDHSLLETVYDEMHAARFINLEPVSLLANMLPLHFRADVIAPPPIVITFPQPPAPAASGEHLPSSPETAETPFPTAGDSDREDHSHVIESPADVGPGMFTFPAVINGRDMAYGTPFVTLDTSRYSGFSPAALRRAALPLPGANPTQIPQSPGGGSAFSSTSPVLMAKVASYLIARGNPLPNKTINFDPRSLNLLLALRVNEVLGCAEPMWDWVVDFQETVMEKTKTVGSPRRSEHLTLRTSRNRRHPKQDALMRLTRLDFDALMRRFELDMKARMYLGAAAEDRLGWAAHPASSSEEREIFEEMCTAWADYEHQRSSSPVLPTPRQSDVEEDPDATLRGRGHAGAHHRHHAPSSAAEGLVRRSSAPPRHSQPGLRASGAVPLRPVPSAPPASSLLSEHEQKSESPPCSRTGRIFVAWKA